MGKVKSLHLIEGGIFNDTRGRVSFVNDFDMSEVKRFYQIRHNDTMMIRAWQGHKVEKKWFYCIGGAFLINIIKIDDWNNPSTHLFPDSFTLTENISNILYLPGGYASGFKALEDNSILLVFSDQSVEESKMDDFRFDKDYWFNWQEL